MKIGLDERLRALLRVRNLAHHGRMRNRLSAALAVTAFGFGPGYFTLLRAARRCLLLPAFAGRGGER